MASALYGAVPFLASAAYLGLASVCLVRKGRSALARMGVQAADADEPAAGTPEARTRRMLRVLLPIALLLQGASLLPAWFGADAVRFGFAHALSWMFWLTLLIVWVGDPRRIAPRAQQMLFPLAAVAVLLPQAFPGHVLLEATSTLFRAHVLMSMLAYAVFGMAAVQAFIIQAQERALHRARPSLAVWSDAPSLLDLERSMVRSVAISQVLLTLVLVSGYLVVMEIWGRMVWDHKSVFALLTWMVTGVLLLGRWRLGWRGRVAARWTLAGFGFLLLAYVGSRFVTEVVLGL